MKKIFGVGENIKNQLISQFRDRKDKLEEQLDRHENDLRSHNYRVKQLEEDNQILIEKLAELQSKYEKEILAYEIEPILSRQPPSPPPPPRNK